MTIQEMHEAKREMTQAIEKAINEFQTKVENGARVDSIQVLQVAGFGSVLTIVKAEVHL